MTVQVDFWQLVLLLIAFFGACAGAFKMLLSQTQRHLDDRFSNVSKRLDSIEVANKEEAAQSQRHLDERFSNVSKRLDSIEISNKEEAAQWARVERELMELKTELPLNYVRREDYIRGQSIIEAKLDGLAVKIENNQLRSLLPGGGK